jgi:hypothetical protein
LREAWGIRRIQVTGGAKPAIPLARPRRKSSVAMPMTLRPCLAVVTATLLFAASASAYQWPLSDEAVRDAYFIGQRHDGTYPRILDKYIKRLPPPKSGPDISSVTFLTPYIQAVEYSDSVIGNYSAQQALQDHRGRDEFVEILVDIQLTDSYGPLIAPPDTTRARSATSLVSRSYDFWQNFRVEIYDGAEPLGPAEVHGHANQNCGQHGDCILTGATIELDFPAEAFDSDCAYVVVTPPEGDQVSTKFDLLSFR